MVAAMQVTRVCCPSSRLWHALTDGGGWPHSGMEGESLKWGTEVSRAVIGAEMVPILPNRWAVPIAHHQGSPADPGHQRPAATSFKNASNAHVCWRLEPLVHRLGLPNQQGGSLVDFQASMTTPRFASDRVWYAVDKEACCFFTGNITRQHDRLYKDVYVPSAVERNSFETNWTAHFVRHAVSERATAPGAAPKVPMRLAATREP